MSANGLISFNLIIDREAQIQSIYETIVNFPNRNVSIVGYSGTGKKLLAKTIINRFLNDSSHEEVVFVEINNYDEDYFYFFLRLVEKTYRVLKTKGLEVPEEIVKHHDIVTRYEESDTWGKFIRNVERFFESIKDCHYRVVIILYIFDEIRHVFKGRNPIYYNALDELTKEQKVTFFTLSKRKIDLIEEKIAKSDLDQEKIRERRLDGGSNYIFSITFKESTFITRYFSEEEVGMIFQHFEELDMSLSDQMKETAYYYAGNNPKLLIEIATCLCENSPQLKDDDLSFFKKKFEKLALENNKSLLKELESLGEKEAYKKLCVDQKSDEHSHLKHKFLDHRIIHENPDGIYRAYSAYFQDYLCQFHGEKGKEELQTKPYEVYVSFSASDANFFDELQKALTPAAQSKNVSIKLTSRNSMSPGNVKEQTLNMIQAADLIYVVCSTDYFSSLAEEFSEIRKYVKKCASIRYQYCDLSLYDWGDLYCIPQGDKPFVDLPTSIQYQEIGKIVKSILEAATSKAQ